MKANYHFYVKDLRLVYSARKLRHFRANLSSVLGPILFLLFINDIEKVIKHSQICLFADDTVLYNSNINKETMELWN